MRAVHEDIRLDDRDEAARPADAGVAHKRGGIGFLRVVGNVITALLRTGW